MTDPILKLATFFLAGIGMAAAPVALSFLLWRQRRKQSHNSSFMLHDSSREREPYESGMPPVGPGRTVGFEYLIYAVLFLFFDVAAILAFLGVLALRHDRSRYILELLALMGLLLVAIAYGVKKREYIKI